MRVVADMHSRAGGAKGLRLYVSDQWQAVLLVAVFIATVAVAMPS